MKKLHEITGDAIYLFPSLRSDDRPISNNTPNAALRRMEFGADEMTAHGLRTMASTRLNELCYDPDAIELQLAHTDRNRVRAAYNRAAKGGEAQDDAGLGGLLGGSADSEKPMWPCSMRFVPKQCGVSDKPDCERLSQLDHPQVPVFPNSRRSNGENLSCICSRPEADIARC